ncbi:hypothetical protein NQ318_009063 [Aromia moschata]|uniref:Uncharacterized protein n=1 Tax=Aromia moschata TaxID=1265417 RepID=A0AAV8YTT6_9CUCU|nr:hypothetical protein NQ318_009063 [Aromia moschata]
MLNNLIIIGFVAYSIASPLPSQKHADSNKILYDQRQEGEWNVRADLKNFIVLVIPTPTVSSSSSSPSLLDFLTKSLPSKPHKKAEKPEKTDDPDAAQETMHFIESKTAPYHVDITKTKEELAKLHPKAEEVVVASSPSIALVKSTPQEATDRSGRARISRALVFTVPADEEFVVTRTEDSKTVVKKDGKKKVIKEVPWDTLKLLGAENEQCGPGMARDSEGVCRTFKRI